MATPLVHTYVYLYSSYTIRNDIVISHPPLLPIPNTPLSPDPPPTWPADRTACLPSPSPVPTPAPLSVSRGDSSPPAGRQSAAPAAGATCEDFRGRRQGARWNGGGGVAYKIGAMPDTQDMMLQKKVWFVEMRAFLPVRAIAGLRALGYGGDSSPMIVQPFWLPFLRWFAHLIWPWEGYNCPSRARNGPNGPLQDREGYKRTERPTFKHNKAVVLGEMDIARAKPYQPGKGETFG